MKQMRLLLLGISKESEDGHRCMVFNEKYLFSSIMIRKAQHSVQKKKKGEDKKG